MIQKNNYQQNIQGFVALMSSIVISVVLLLVTTEALFLGWSTRFMTLSAEAKQVSVYQAKGCANEVITRLVQYPQYNGDETIIYKVGTCRVSPLSIVKDGSSTRVTVMVQMTVRNIQTRHEYVYQLNDIHLGVPLSSDVIPPSTMPNVRLQTWREVY
jgi:hypothetical protein